MTAPKDIRLICGLGNPGERYSHTRHNVGFAVVDALAVQQKVKYWKEEAGCLISFCAWPNQDGSERQIVLAKPQGYMNTSGGPLSKLMRRLEISPQEILVVHDEVDLPAGAIRVKFGGGLNAHNGLRSISAKLGTHDFARVKCGIGRPPGKMSVADYVLRPLKGSFLEQFECAVQQAAIACVLSVDEGVAIAEDHAF